MQQDDKTSDEDKRQRPRPRAQQLAIGDARSARSLLTMNRAVNECYGNAVIVGQGGYGVVYKATNLVTNEVVAIKKVKTYNERGSIEKSTMREVHFLRKLKHDNIIKLIEVCSSSSSSKPHSYLVLEYCEVDLRDLIMSSPNPFSLAEKKMIMSMLMEALDAMHTQNIMHRDLKESNILVTSEGVLKLADFGSACSMSDLYYKLGKGYSNPVATLWYRAPEVLLGDSNYDMSIDIWAAGIVLYDLWTRWPLMRGTDNKSQLREIIQHCGGINQRSMPTKVALFGNQPYVGASATKARKLTQRAQTVLKNVSGVDLLDRMLTLEPSRRITAKEALGHEFLADIPRPLSLQTCLMNFYNLHGARKQVDASGKHYSL